MESEAKLNEKYIVFWYIIFQVLKVVLIKKVQDTANLPVPLFLVVLHCISRYRFYNFLESNPKFSEKKDFHREFSFFLTDSLNHTSLKGQRSKSVKRDESFLLMLPKFGKFLVFYLDCGCMTFNFTTQMTYVTFYPCPWIKSLSAKTTKNIQKYWERSVKRKSNLSFIRVIKNSSFDQCFLYVRC